MQIGTMIKHVENGAIELGKAADDIKLEECHPIEFYQNCSERVYGIQTSLNTLRKALTEKIQECL